MAHQPTTGIDEEKQRCREEARERRAALAVADQRAPAPRAAERLRDLVLGRGLWRSAACLSFYWPLPEELDARPLAEALIARGQAVALPVMQGAGQPLLFRRWQPGDRLRKVRFGVREPEASAPLQDPDVMLVPLLAFDRRGYRMGYGGGFYDRSLAEARGRRAVVAVGLAFAGQECAAVPHDARDQRLDLVVTEAEVIATV